MAKVAGDKKHQHFIDIGKISQILRVTWMLELAHSHGFLVDGQRHEHINFRSG